MRLVVYKFVFFFNSRNCKLFHWFGIVSYKSCRLKRPLDKSAIVAAGEFELIFTTNEVYKIVRISKSYLAYDQNF